MHRALPILLLVSTWVGCREPPSAVFHEDLDRERVTRVNFRPDGETLRSSNVLSAGSLIPAGTAARVTLYSEKEIRIVLGKEAFKLVPLMSERFPTTGGAIDTFLDKYFADLGTAVDPAALGPAEPLEKVLSGHATLGMTKQQVYACLGPPFKIDDGKSALELSREEILASDHWIYPEKWVLVVPDFIDLYFGDGLLQKQVP